jgi:thiamine pyrophosphokinase
MIAKKIVILANGEFPSHPKSLEILKSAEFIICCDGAADSLLRAGMEPDLIIGDLDSLNKQNKEKFCDRVIQIQEQETNDLTKAFEHSLSLNPSSITILGATGKREDHTIGNISLLSLFGEKTDIPLRMVSDYGIFTPIFNTTNFISKKGDRVSVFSLDCNIELKSDGLDYPLKDVKFDSWWRATLNVASGDNFTISFPKGGGRVIVFTTHS